MINPRTAAESFKKRSYERQLGIFSGADILTIVRTLTTDDEKRRINDAKADAMMNKPIYSLKDIKEHFCLSWNEMRSLVINF